MLIGCRRCRGPCILQQHLLTVPLGIPPVLVIKYRSRFSPGGFTVMRFVTGIKCAGVGVPVRERNSLWKFKSERQRKYCTYCILEGKSLLKGGALDRLANVLS
jgi:hypothetical protein